MTSKKRARIERYIKRVQGTVPDQLENQVMFALRRGENQPKRGIHRTAAALVMSKFKLRK